MEKKRGSYRGSGGDGFIPSMTTFYYWGGDMEGAEVALTGPWCAPSIDRSDG
jgi:hypothetical protein